MRRSSLCSALALIVLSFLFSISAFSQTLPNDGYQDFSGIESLVFNYYVNAKDLIGEIAGYDIAQAAHEYENNVPPQTLHRIKKYAEYERYLDWLEEKGYRMRFGYKEDKYDVLINPPPSIGQLMVKDGQRLFVFAVHLQDEWYLKVYDLSALPETYIALIDPPVYEKPQKIPETIEEYSAAEEYIINTPSPWGYQALMNRFTFRTSSKDPFEYLSDFGMGHVIDEITKNEDNIEYPNFYSRPRADRCLLSDIETLNLYLDKLKQHGFEEIIRRNRSPSNKDNILMIYDQGPDGGRIIILFEKNSALSANLLSTIDISEYGYEFMTPFYVAYGNKNSMYDFRSDESGAHIIRFKGEVRERDNLIIPSLMGGLPLKGIDAFAFQNAKHLRSITLPESIDTIDLDAFWGMRDTIIRAPVGSRAADAVAATGHIRLDNYRLPRKKYKTERGSVENYDYETLPDGTLRITKYTGPITEEIHVPCHLSGAGFVTVIGKDAFTDFSIPEQLENNKIVSFAQFPNLIIESGITTIESGAIKWHPKIEETPWLYLPETLTNIEPGAIVPCAGGTVIAINPNNPVYRFDADGDDYYLIDKRSNTLHSILSDETRAVVHIPQGILHIGPEACMNQAREEVILPEGLLSIGDRAFQGNNCLTNIHLPSSLVRIGHEAFMSTGLTELKLPYGIKSIGRSIVGWTRISSLRLPASLQVLEGHPGKKTYPDLQPIKLSIDKGNSSLTIRDGAVFDQERSALLFLLNPTELKTYRVPSGTLSLGPMALQDAQELVYLELPQSLQDIGNLALPYSKKTRVMLPNNIRFIGDMFYFSCIPFLLDWRGGEETCYLVDSFYNSKQNIALNIQVRPGSELEAKLKDRGFGTLLSHDEQLYTSKMGIYSLNPAGEAALLRGPFSYNYVFVFPSEIDGHPLVEIGPRSCRGMTNEQLRFQPPLKIIGDEAFDKNSNSQRILLPESLEYIGRQAFSLREGDEVILLSKTLQIDENAFGNDCFKVDFHLEHDSLSYKLAEMGCDIDSCMSFSFVLEGDWLCYTREIDGVAIHSYWGDPDENFSIPLFVQGHSVKEISDGAGINIRGVQNLNIQAPLVRIGNSAFVNSTSLDKLILPEGLKTLGHQIINSNYLEYIKLPATLGIIPEDAFGKISSPDKLEFDVAPRTASELWVKSKGLLYHIDEKRATTSLFSWRLREDGLAEITGYSGPQSSCLVIPGEIDGQQINIIAAEAAIDLSMVSELSIQAPISQIGTNAFGSAPYLHTLNLPETLIRVDIGAMDIWDLNFILHLPDNYEGPVYGAFGNEFDMYNWHYTATPGSPAEQMLVKHNFPMTQIDSEDEFDWLNTP